MISIEEISARVSGLRAGDESCFWTRAGRGYRDGLARMAELPNDDPFWTGTNGSETPYKLTRFCESLLERDPQDARALWSLIGEDVDCCSNELQERCWRTLLELGDFRPGWLVEHAYWVWAVSGADTVPLVADVLNRHRLVAITRTTLLEMRSINEKWIDRLVSATE